MSVEGQRQTTPMLGVKQAAAIQHGNGKPSIFVRILEPCTLAEDLRSVTIQKREHTTIKGPKRLAKDKVKRCGVSSGNRHDHDWARMPDQQGPLKLLAHMKNVLPI